MKKFNVYDKVWLMKNNKPVQWIIFAVVESMDNYKTGTEIYYHVVKEKCGAGWGNNEGYKYREEDLFATKTELIESLYDK